MTRNTLALLVQQPALRQDLCTDQLPNISVMAAGHRNSRSYSSDLIAVTQGDWRDRRVFATTQGRRR